MILDTMRYLESQFIDVLDGESTANFQFVLDNGDNSDDSATFFINRIPPKENENPVMVNIMVAGGSQGGVDIPAYQNSFATLDYQFFVNGLESSDIPIMLEVIAFIADKLSELGYIDMNLNALEQDELSDTYNISLLTEWRA